VKEQSNRENKVSKGNSVKQNKGTGSDTRIKKEKMDKLRKMTE